MIFLYDYNHLFLKRVIKLSKQYVGRTNEYLEEALAKNPGLKVINDGLAVSGDNDLFYLYNPDLSFSNNNVMPISWLLRVYVQLYL